MIARLALIWAGVAAAGHAFVTTYYYGDYHNKSAHHLDLYLNFAHVLNLVSVTLAVVLGLAGLFFARQRKTALLALLIIPMLVIADYCMEAFPPPPKRVGTNRPPIGRNVSFGSNLRCPLCLCASASPC